MSRKDLHDETEQKMLYGNLPKLFLTDAVSKFEKHFVKQWLSDVLLPLTLAGEPSVSKYFTRWLLNTPVDDTNIVSELHKDNMHLPSFTYFVTKSASLENIKVQCFFASLKNAIFNSLFDSDDDDIKKFR